MAEAGASFIKTSMFPSAGPFSGAVFFVEYWTIQHNYKRCEQVTRLLVVNFLRNEATNESNEFLNRRMMTAAHNFNEKLYH